MIGHGFRSCSIISKCSMVLLMKINIVQFLVLCVVIFISGCETLKKPAEVLLPEKLPENWSADVPVEQLAITNNLLDLIDSKELRKVVVEALSNNPDIRATALRLKSAGYMLDRKSVV